MSQPGDGRIPKHPLSDRLDPVTSVEDRTGRRHLVAKSTIEDRIVALHHTKRDLADSVLAGTDASADLSLAELVALLQSA